MTPELSDALDGIIQAAVFGWTAGLGFVVVLLVIGKRR